MRDGKEIITVRNWLLLEVNPEDGKPMAAVADKWVSTLRKVLLKVAPKPSLTGL